MMAECMLERKLPDTDWKVGFEMARNGSRNRKLRREELIFLPMGVGGVNTLGTGLSAK